ncbi:MAG: LPS export ABC transporter ATP-binding protein [Verrucomicrobia bacterium]|nr:LPS export ABC transporter ATP-binding protein [Verrucomicrobiota bacterium]MCH8512155.1 LPS export ABC transporter ATP-binding protein [Kiritimatiellia bacterium]
MDAPESPRREINPVIQTEGLVKIYGGKRVVNEVDIRVERNEIVGLLGANGAGKTTTFYMITGLIKPNAGKVFFDGREITAMPMFERARLGMGYLAQEPSVFRRLTVEDNIKAILETLPLSPSARKERLAKLLDDLKITHLAKQKAFTLSGGERRRLEIARALVSEPAVLLLDEPFSGVDPKAVNDVQEIILELKERGLGILITDHNVRETLTVTDRAYIIFEGKVLREGTQEFLVTDQVSRDLYLGDRFSM